ncbi:tRNA 2-thiocytidine biosynthesis protein TtcA [Andreprevotia lacus DSM 23236]|uniref:tRNA-cytidine(32) 2-sulfurtransferase n=2 Tax=Andreprevotia TaxID=397275 RepID=A0A1W1Y1Q9_9NEIS|nr:tRNA 2-thiocytidine biosynthesis protein TtcA [Andreprevotia lacus DSM 23236]
MASRFCGKIIANSRLYLGARCAPIPFGGQMNANTDTAALNDAELDAARKQQQKLNKLNKWLRHAVGDAINDFNMIEEGDRVMVCLSGGKDSYTMLDILLSLQRSAPINFSIVAVNLDQKQPGFPEHVLPEYLAALGVEYRIIEEDTYSIVKKLVPEGKTTCSLCSRLRRGILYRVADELGATKIALGHHREDILETLFLNMFYGGKLKAMPPKLVSDDGKHVVIRPLAYCREKDIVKYSEIKGFPIIPCNLCGSQPNLQRAVIGEMIADWDKRFPGRIETMFRSLQNVVPSHLADTKLYDFANAKADGVAREDGDKAFDKETFSDPGRISILASKPADAGDCGADD